MVCWRGSPWLCALQGTAEPKSKHDFCVKELVETEKNYVEALNLIVQVGTRLVLPASQISISVWVDSHPEAELEGSVGYSLAFVRLCCVCRQNDHVVCCPFQHFILPLKPPVMLPKDHETMFKHIVVCTHSATSSY